jgi:hypothetical protein
VLGFVNNSRDFAKQNSADALSHRGSFKVDGAPRDSMLDTVDESDCRLEHNHFTYRVKRIRRQHAGEHKEIRYDKHNSLNQAHAQCGCIV